jgi:CRP-like cAMP-binding protein
MGEEVVEALKRSEMFGGLALEHLRRIAAYGKEINFSPGEELIAEGGAGGRFFLILEGSAEVSIGGSAVRTLGPSDGVGEVALLDGGPRSARVVAQTPLRTFSLASFNFRPLMSEPEISQAVITLLCRRLRQAEADRGAQ